MKEAVWFATPRSIINSRDNLCQSRMIRCMEEDGDIISIFRGLGLNTKFTEYTLSTSLRSPAHRILSKGEGTYQIFKSMIEKYVEMNEIISDILRNSLYSLIMSPHILDMAGRIDGRHLIEMLLGREEKINGMDVDNLLRGEDNTARYKSIKSKTKPSERFMKLKRWISLMSTCKNMSNTVDSIASKYPSNVKGIVMFSNGKIEDDDSMYMDFEYMLVGTSNSAIVMNGGLSVDHEKSQMHT